MKRLLILILILLGLFFVFFYFFLGTEPRIVGREIKPTEVTPLGNIIKSYPKEYPYVFIEGTGYVLKDRRIVLLVGEDTTQSSKGKAIKGVEKELESYWKWQVLSGKKNIEELINSQQDNEYEPGENKREKKNIFSRFFDVFKVADAVNVVQDNSKTCDCDDNLILLSGKDLHLIATTLNPDGAGIGMPPPPSDGIAKLEKGQNFKQSQSEPQAGIGQKTPLIVGIIDSGINFGISPKYATSGVFGGETLITPMMNNTLHYNFVEHNSDISDKNKIIHGTKIARIITNKVGSTNIEIVGLKTYDNRYVGNLFDNLCAIIYAMKHNIKVVNASWGTNSSEPIPVFEEVLRRAKANNMVIICSAGNQKFDLDKNPYYPACYTDNTEIGNYIITVTSKKDSVCQNYSSSGKKIDLSCQTDIDCGHSIPSSSGGAGTSEPGTSYAAPYVTADVIKYLSGTSGAFSKSGYLGLILPTSDIKKYKN